MRTRITRVAVAALAAAALPLAVALAVPAAGAVGGAARTGVAPVSGATAGTGLRVPPGFTAACARAVGPHDLRCFAEWRPSVRGQGAAVSGTDPAAVPSRRILGLYPAAIRSAYGIAALRGTGTVAVVETRPACRLALTGPAAALAGLLPTLTTLRLSVPRASLAREAIAVGRSTLLPARHLGAPSLDGEISVSDGLAAIVSHLLDVLLFWTDTFRSRRDPEAIHQARVATRRLRSALSIYKPAAPCAELAEAASAVKHCAATLGAARDWDVFIAGTGASLVAVSGRDPRIRQLLRAASRRRDIAYAELLDYLDGPRFRHLELSLGVATALRPWDRSDPDRSEGALHAPTAPFAITVLTRRLKHVRQRGREIDTLAVADLHELRKECKRLRYAAEFFAPAFAAKRTRPFLRRLGALQEELGALNDTAASAVLMAQLGRAGRGYAGGMVDGMAAAAALPARVGMMKSWKRFKQAGPFWR